MKLLKKNQIILYVIAIMLMTAGYFNYYAKPNQNMVETSIQMESKDDMQLAEIGDAKLVSSNEIVKEETNERIDNNKNSNIQTENIETNKENNSTLETTSENIEKVTDDYFIKSKLERDTMYSQILESYENILNSTNSPETQKQIATQEIQKINEIKNSIMICENLIKTKGIEEIIIFTNKESINVIIKAEEIQQEKIAQIQNIITREMKANIENIHISNK